MTSFSCRMAKMKKTRKVCLKFDRVQRSLVWLNRQLSLVELNPFTNTRLVSSIKYQLSPH